MLDTNICVYIINNNPAQVKHRFLEHQVGDIGLSSIVVAELAYGVEKSKFRTKNIAALEKFLIDLEILVFDVDAAHRHGALRADLERAGTVIGPLDLQIAAHTLALNATLITNNTVEFSRVKALKLENWFA